MWSSARRLHESTGVTQCDPLAGGLHVDHRRLQESGGYTKCDPLSTRGSHKM